MMGMIELFLLMLLQVEEWNNAISRLNPNEERTLKSSCWMSEVDDDHGHLANMITDDVMMKFDRVGIPPHELKLKARTFYTVWHSSVMTITR